MSIDSSTIPVTIGLDVLEHLIGMAEPEGTDDRAMLLTAHNAAKAARRARRAILDRANSSQLTDQVERDLRFTIDQDIEHSSGLDERDLPGGIFDDRD
jgi:hypothetical protein